MSQTDFHQLYREAYESHVPELRIALDEAWDSDPAWMSKWMARRDELHSGKPIELAGCSPEQVDHIQEIHARPLPASYRAYLEVMGQYHGMSNPDYAMLYRWVQRLNDRDAPAFIDELRKRGKLDAADLEVLGDAVFVGSHEGYNYLFIRDVADDDPPVSSLYGPSGLVELLHDGEPVLFSEIVLGGIESAVGSARSAWRVPKTAQLSTNWSTFWSQWLKGREVLGAEAVEIDEITAGQGLDSLPAAYEWFLRSAGRGVGNLWHGYDAFSPELVDLKSGAAALLEECNADVSLGKDDVVFLMQRGYEFFILRGSVPNPPVFHFRKGRNGLKPVAATFSEFMVAALRS